MFEDTRTKKATESGHGDDDTDDVTMVASADLSLERFSGAPSREGGGGARITVHMQLICHVDVSKGLRAERAPSGLWGGDTGSKPANGRLGRGD